MRLVLIIPTKRLILASLLIYALSQVAFGLIDNTPVRFIARFTCGIA